MSTLDAIRSDLHTSRLPSGWRWVALGEVCQRIDYGYTASADVAAKSPRFLRITDIQNGRVDWEHVPGCSISQDDMPAYALADGDIVFARTGATTGKSYLIAEPPPAVFASYLIRLRADERLVEPTFLYWYFQSDEYWWRISEGARGGAQDGFNATMLAALRIPLPPLPEQKQILAVLREQMSAVEKARAAAHSRLEAALALPAAFARETIQNGQTQRRSLGDCLVEVRNGVGTDWAKYPVLGATRAGLAPAKEAVGKAPERYKLVEPVTVFYNPMRILLGSIAMVDEGDATGITSPDYVVVKGQPGILDTRWFYYWFRSARGAHLIDSLSRGAVRERILFNRLAAGEIEIPDYETQLQASERMKQVRPIVDSITKELETIDALPAAILRRVFAGVA